MSAALPTVLRLSALPATLDAEQMTQLAAGRRFRLEHILSGDHASAPGFWYDQAEDEFVVLVAGQARLRFEAGDVVLDLAPGDWVEIPAHARHRVEATQAEPATVWLAVHLGPTA